MTEPVRVFISYSWSSDAHQRDVIEFAERLMANGVEVSLDVWDVKEGADLLSFMETMVTDQTIKKVLIICDRVYAEKANARSGGVGRESEIISPEVYNKVSQNKFIPIVFERSETQAYLPVFLTTRSYIDFSTPDKRYSNFEQVLRAVFDQPLHRKPSVGTPPRHIFENAPSRSSTGVLFDRVHDAVAQGRPQTLPLVREYFRKMLEQLGALRISEHNPSSDYDDTIMGKITDLLPLRDEVVDLFILLVEYQNSDAVYDEVAEFFQGLLHLQFRQEADTVWFEPFADHFRFFSHELFLYFIAALFRGRRYQDASSFLEREFFILNPMREQGKFYDYTDFWSRLESLDGNRNRRLKLNRLSVVADIFRDRSTRADISFSDLCDTDVLLYFRSVLREKMPGAASQWWIPITVVHNGFSSRPVRFLSMAESAKHFDTLKTILAVPKDVSGAELLRRYSANGGKPSLSFGSGWPVAVPGLGEFKALGTRP